MFITIQRSQLPFQASALESTAGNGILKKSLDTSLIQHLFSPVEVCPKEQKAVYIFCMCIQHCHMEATLGQSRLKSNDERTVRWVCNIRPDRIYVEKLGTRLKLKSMRECLQDRRLQQFGLPERIEDGALEFQKSINTANE